MADEPPTGEDTPPPALITPLESGYIRIAITAALPAINWIIYSTNLDEVFHITKLTTNQVWQGVNAGLTVLTVVLTILKRLKEGRDPKSTAPRIVMRMPAQPPVDPRVVVQRDEYADILADTHPESGHKTQEQLLADYKERQRRYGNLPPPIPAQKPVSGENRRKGE